MSNFHHVVSKARETFDSGKTRSYEFRKKQLLNFKRMVEENGDKIAQSLEQDLKKCKMESFFTEIGLLVTEIDYILENLKQWMAPAEPEKNLITMLDKVRIYNDPKGVVLVMGAWNYPINLTLMPVIGAISAGNCVVIKPSEVAPASANVIAELIPKYLDPECYQVCLGGVAETTELLKEKFDHIMYTGSTVVGRIIYAAANKNLTPVTLELGGKSPCYVDDTVNLNYAVKRIMWGKCINAGQTCIAPDYMLCTKEVQDKFVKEAKKVIEEWYGSNAITSPDYCRIVSDRHFKRLEKMLQNAEIAYGGQTDPKERYFGPTILTNVNPNHPVMKEEIFGPIMPIVTIANAHEAIKFINARDRPLTSYVFTKDKQIQDLFLENTISGSAVVNDTLIQFGVHTLPFGGVGESGMGAYHGKYSFDTFTHKKSTIIKNYNSLGEKVASARYPPYSDRKLGVMQALMRVKLNFGFFKYAPHAALFAAGLAAGIAYNQYKVRPLPANLPFQVPQGILDRLGLSQEPKPSS